MGKLKIRIILLTDAPSLDSILDEAQHLIISTFAKVSSRFLYGFSETYIKDGERSDFMGFLIS